jgi:hypothetical protein
MNQALKILGVTKPPSTPDLPEGAIEEVMNICPVVAELVQAGATDPFTQGTLVALCRIYDSLLDNNLESVLFTLSQENLAIVDSLLINDPDATGQILTPLPMVRRMLEEAKKATGSVPQFQTGVLLAFAGVAKSLLETEGTEFNTPEPPAAPPPVPTPGPAAGPHGDDGTTAPPVQDVTAVDPTRKDHKHKSDIHAILKSFADAGIDPTQFTIKPSVTEGGVDLIVVADLGMRLDFPDLTRINAVYRQQTGKDLAVQSQATMTFAFTA